MSGPLAKASTTTTTIGYALGHVRTTTTDRYLHKSERAGDRVLSKVGEAELSGGDSGGVPILRRLRARRFRRKIRVTDGARTVWTAREHL